MCPRESLSNTHFAYMFLSQCLGAVLEKPFSFYVAAGVLRCIFFWINLFWRLWPSLLCGICRVAVSRAALWLQCSASGCGRVSCGGLQAVLHRLRSRGTWVSCPVARGIVPDQVSNLCPLPWQVGSYPLYHWGSPCMCILNKNMVPISRSWRYSHLIPIRKFIYHLLFLGLEMCMNKFLFDMTYSLRLISLSS